MTSTNAEDEKVMHSHSTKEGANHGFVLYKRRWFMLAVVVFFNISNAMIWISFAPITNYSSAYFDISETTVNWFSLVFFIVYAPFAGLSWYLIENVGFRFSVILGTILNAVGAIIRAVGAIACSSGKQKFLVVLIGQILAACTQPLVLSMPTKLAALWFGDHERTTANTIGSMANPLGVLIANGAAVGIVSSANDIKLMLIIFAIPAVIGALMAIFGFWSSAPPTPPSASALIQPASFFAGVKQALQNKSFLLLMFVTGMGIGVFSAITSFLQQLICVKGYNNTIAAVAGALVVVGGFIGAGLSGAYIDRTRKYIDIAKIISLFLGLSAAAVVIVTSMRHEKALIFIVFTLIGFFALGALPVFLELGVECTYPVDEATSSGLLWMVGQILGAVMLLGSVAASPKLSPEQLNNSACVVDGDQNTVFVDLSIPVAIMVAVCVLACILFVMFFDTKYKRLLAEEQMNIKYDETPHDDNKPRVL